MNIGDIVRKRNGAPFRIRIEGAGVESFNSAVLVETGHEIVGLSLGGKIHYYDRVELEVIGLRGEQPEQPIPELQIPEAWAVPPNENLIRKRIYKPKEENGIAYEDLEL